MSLLLFWQAGSLTNYSLTATGGSYALTGANASLERGLKVAATGGSHAINGTAASLEYGREVAAGAGSYVISGTAVTLKAARKIIVAAGSCALTGTGAALSKGRTLTAAGASYALTGASAALKAGRIVTASGDSYAISGTDADFVITAATATLRGRRRRVGRRVRRDIEPEKQEATKALTRVIDLELPPRDGLLHNDVLEARNAAEYAELEARKILDFMESEDAEKRRKRRMAAYLLLIH